MRCPQSKIFNIWNGECHLQPLEMLVWIFSVYFQLICKRETETNTNEYEFRLFFSRLSFFRRFIFETTHSDEKHNDIKKETQIL